MSTNKLTFQLLMLACTAFFMASVQALALSEAQLKSHLNQRLDVRIELMSIEQSELDDLKVKLTSMAEENTKRLHLKYEILKGESGNFLKITSKDVIQEPVVTFQVDINWSKGHVIREYSLLIDPSGN